MCDLYPKDGRMEELYDVDNKTQCLLFCAFTYTEVCKHFMYHYQSKICEIFNVEIEKVFHGCLTIQGPKYPSLIDCKSEVDPCYVSKSKQIRMFSLRKKKRIGQVSFFMYKCVSLYLNV